MSCFLFETCSKSILAHPLTSKLVDRNMKRGFYVFILILPLVLYLAIFLCSWFSSMMRINFLISA